VIVRICSPPKNTLRLAKWSRTGGIFLHTGVGGERREDPSGSRRPGRWYLKIFMFFSGGDWIEGFVSPKTREHHS